MRRPRGGCRVWRGFGERVTRLVLARCNILYQPKDASAVRERMNPRQAVTVLREDFAHRLATVVHGLFGVQALLVVVTSGIAQDFGDGDHRAARELDGEAALQLLAFAHAIGR